MLSKNILDLAINYPDALNTKHLHKDLHGVEKAVKERFDLTIDAVKTQDVQLARNLLKGIKEKGKYEIQKESLKNMDVS